MLLAGGAHSLNIKRQDDDDADVSDVPDETTAAVTATVTATATATATAASTSTTTTSHALDDGTKGGIAIGVIVAIIAIAGAIFMYLRSRRRRLAAAQNAEKRALSPGQQSSEMGDAGAKSWVNVSTGSGDTRRENEEVSPVGLLGYKAELPVPEHSTAELEDSGQVIHELPATMFERGSPTELSVSPASTTAGTWTTLAVTPLSTSLESGLPDHLAPESVSSHSPGHRGGSWRPNNTP